jgi:hypothetical protein
MSLWNWCWTDEGAGVLTLKPLGMKMGASAASLRRMFSGPPRLPVYETHIHTMLVSLAQTEKGGTHPDDAFLPGF